MDLDVHLQGILDRDPAAFARWMAGAEPSIRESLRSFAKVVDVEAILQETLLRVWHVAPRFVQDGAPNGLLRLGVRIGRNLAISEVRRTRARPVADIEEASDEREPGEPEMPDPLLRRVLARCFELLPDQPRRVLGVRLASSGANGDGDAASAQSLGMRLNTFLQNVGRARRMLGECLRKNGVVVDEGLVG